MSKHFTPVGPPITGTCRITTVDGSVIVESANYTVQLERARISVRSRGGRMTTPAGKEWRGTITLNQNPRALMNINTPILVLSTELPNGALKMVIELRRNSLLTGIYDVVEYSGHE
jgi:hypothetical protein